MKRLNLATLRHRRAVTITEVVVSLAILGLLAALLLPALGATRESSRRITCANHLHQMGVAWSSAAASSGSFPTADPAINGKRGGFSRLLRHLEQKSLADRLEGGNSSMEPTPTLVEVFLCPSDPLPFQNQCGNCSYLVNDGTRFRYSPAMDGGPREYGFNGFSRGPHIDTQPREITDGLSQTAAMAERLVAQWGKPAPAAEVTQRESGRYYGWTPRQYTQPGEEPLAIAMCRTEIIPPTYMFLENNCVDWRCQVGYDHMLTPNVRACYNTVDYTSAENELLLLPPSSLHPGGVNLLLADGRTTFVSDSIGGEVWTAIGSRNGSEAAVLSW